MRMTDRIERQILLRAPRTRVWKALTDKDEFSSWFQVKLDTGFAPGQEARGHITYPGYEHLAFSVVTGRMEPETYFSFHWHPYAIDPAVD